jgi:hypothetical protein
MASGAKSISPGQVTAPKVGSTKAAGIGDLREYAGAGRVNLVVHVHLAFQPVGELRASVLTTARPRTPGGKQR